MTRGIGFLMSGWMTFLLFCGFVLWGRYLIFTPSDIRGQSDFRKFEIAVQGKDNPKQLVFCMFEPGPAREINLNTLQSTCAFKENEIFELGSLMMANTKGLVPVIKEEPDYGWARYEVLSEEGNSQLIETETYYNSDSLFTRYRVSGTYIEPVGQAYVPRGIIQMFVVFYLPLSLLLAKLAAMLLRRVIRQFYKIETLT